ncbi:MAG: cell wall biogenesis protein [Candidatus Omnitrophica bacterium CG11_big_fil_rev_8_21_14_0_20_64_10]|nr:MAG: cell wall biogenesis protein [Candidatus Omnitrophica bacterium CG11_big_fil_rev_8_21_14_0_20_64_10]
MSDAVPVPVSEAARSIPFGRPWITDAEREAVAAVLDGPVLTHGPVGAAFGEAFAAFLGEGAIGIPVSSCMAALHLSVWALGWGPEDEVIVPAQTHVATVHAVAFTGARPIFVDCDPATGNLTAERIEAAWTPKTRGIVLVHFVGIPCAMPAIRALADRKGVPIVEDCALAIGSRVGGRSVGLWGEAGCYSFYPVKQITTGEGGMWVTRDPALAQVVRKLHAFGVDRSHGERTLPGMYDVIGLGLNYRMSELSAALGLTQIRRYPEMQARRQENFDRLKRGLAGCAGARLLDRTAPDQVNSHYCAVVVLENASRAQRDQMVMRLKARGIGTSIYYPRPVPLTRYYRERFGAPASDFPNAVRISDGSIALPVGPHISPGDIEWMARVFRELYKEVTG